MQAMDILNAIFYVYNVPVRQFLHEVSFQKVFFLTIKFRKKQIGINVLTFFIFDFYRGKIGFFSNSLS